MAHNLSGILGWEEKELIERRVNHHFSIVFPSCPNYFVHEFCDKVIVFNKITIFFNFFYCDFLNFIKKI